MKTLHNWFDEYAVSHQNPTNRLIHKICVPAIFFSVIGLLRLIPGEWPGYVVMGVALVWYFTLGMKPFFFMWAQMIIANVLAIPILGLEGYMPAWVFLGIFVVAWIGQFIGHKIEGKKPSFLQDLQFLLIGPLWVIFH